MHRCEERGCIGVSFVEVFSSGIYKPWAAAGLYKCSFNIYKLYIGYLSNLIELSAFQRQRGIEDVQTKK